MTKTNQSNSERPIVIGVTINILYPDGNCRTVTVDPTRTEAVFWSERAVLQMLAPFYDLIDKTVTREQLIDRFGDTPALEKVINNNEEIKITPNVIEQLWNAENSDGLPPAFIQKTRQCIPRPQPDR